MGISYNFEFLFKGYLQSSNDIKSSHSCAILSRDACLRQARFHSFINFDDFNWVYLRYQECFVG